MFELEEIPSVSWASEQQINKVSLLNYVQQTKALMYLFVVQEPSLIRCALECLPNANHDCDAVKHERFNCKIGRIDEGINSDADVIKVWRRKGRVSSIFFQVC